MKWQLFLIAIAFTGNAVYGDQHRSERDFSIDLQELKEKEQTLKKLTEREFLKQTYVRIYHASDDNQYSISYHRLD
jgi:hypothetical protein